MKCGAFEAQSAVLQTWQEVISLVVSYHRWKVLVLGEGPASSPDGPSARETVDPWDLQVAPFAPFLVEVPSGRLLSLPEQPLRATSLEVVVAAYSRVISV